MDRKHIPNELTPELEQAYARHRSRKATDDDLLDVALFEVHQALMSTPPHCLPAEGGLPHSEDHANAASHRGLGVLRELYDRRQNGRIVIDLMARVVAASRAASAALRSRLTGSEMEKIEVLRVALDALDEVAIKGAVDSIVQRDAFVRSVRGVSE